MDNCIFCKIVKGELPSAKIYENEDVVALLDISQVTKGHTLIIPKQHVRNLYDLTPELSAKIYAVVPVVARMLQKAFKPLGINLLNNNEAFAGQTVFHYHVHLIPRYDKEDGFGMKWQPKKDANLAEIATIIREENQS